MDAFQIAVLSHRMLSGGRLASSRTAPDRRTLPASGRALHLGSKEGGGHTDDSELRDRVPIVGVPGGLGDPQLSEQVLGVSIAPQVKERPNVQSQHDVLVASVRIDSLESRHLCAAWGTLSGPKIEHYGFARWKKLREV